ncbi:MAG: hypothetical protein P9M13_01330 [Candidatus Ancaeobacter aquaticus]|nr:hypothetical protein [Candidatus Ancaeobacter aquaticus]
MKKIVALMVLLGVVLMMSSIGFCAEGPDAIGGPEILQEGATIEDSPTVNEFAGKTYVCPECNASFDEPGRCPIDGQDLVEENVKE